MKLAIPVRAEQVATTFDFAHELVVVECADGRERRRERVELGDAAPACRAKCIGRLGVDVLICGAVSRALAVLLQEAGIQVVPLVSGAVEEVLSAYLGGRIGEARFLLPGCSVEDREVLLGS